MAESSELFSSALSFPKLNGDNYRQWSFNIKMLLCHQGLFGFAEGSEVKPGADKPEADRREYHRRCQKAMATIAMAVEVEQQNLLMGLTKPDEMWKVLEEAYEPSSRARIAALRIEFMNVRFQPPDSMAIYLGRLKQAKDRLEAAGKVVPDDEYTYQMLMHLPSEYSNTVQQLYQLKDEEFKSEKVRKSLLAEYDRLKFENADVRTPNSIFHTKASEQCSSKASAAPKIQRKCFVCGKPGHIASQCLSRTGSPSPSKKPTNTKKSYFADLPSDDNIVCFNQGLNELDWVIDSGASHHFISDRNYLHNVRECNITVGCIDNEKVKVECVGEIEVQFECNGVTETLVLKDVYWGPSFKRNLMSGSKIDLHKFCIVIRDSKCKIYNPDRSLFAIANLDKNLYILRTRVVQSKSLETNMNVHVKSKGIRDSVIMWHKRFGHQNADSIKAIANKQLVFGLEKLKGSIDQCEECIEAKMTRANFQPLPGRSASKPLELLHIDLWSCTSGPSFGGANYLFTIVDDYSRYAFVFPLRNKSDCFETFKLFKAEVENTKNKKIKCIRSDNGMEFCSLKFENFLKDMGIRVQRTNPFSPEMNGIAERLNRSIAEGIRALMFEGELPKKLWAELAVAFAYLRNRCSHRGINGEIPYTLWFGKKCSVRHLKVIGSLAYVYVENHKRKKLDRKCKTGVLVGYAVHTKGYRIWFPKEKVVQESKHVKFNELIKGYKHTPLITAKNSQVSPSNLVRVHVSGMEESSPETSPPPPPKHCKDIQWIRREVKRKKGRSAGRTDVYYFPPDNNLRLRSLRDVEIYCGRNNIIFDSNMFNFKQEVLNSKNDDDEDIRNNSQETDPNLTSLNCILEPSTYEEAMSSSEAKNWKLAMNEEINVLEERNVFEIVKRPPNKRVLGSRWVYKLKKDNRKVKQYRARLVAQGFKQVPGVDYFDTFSPVINFGLIVLFFVLLVICKNWVHRHVDVKCAYLYGNLTEETYMEIPKGFDNIADSGDHVMLLKRSIYGLHQAARQWFCELEQVLLNLKFSKVMHCNCVYMYGTNTIILVYVDDIVVFSKSESDMRIVLNLISSRFDIKDLGSISKILGVEFEFVDGKWLLHQQSYIDNLVKTFNNIPFVKCKVPMSTGITVQADKETPSVEGEFPYRNLIGSLSFLASRSRMDILFVVNFLSQFNSHPTFAHWKLLCQVFNYVKSTRNYCIKISASGTKDLWAYCDASWASNRDDRKSVSGLMTFFCNVPISWRSIKQKCIALSTMESEYIAISDTVREILWFKEILNECSDLGYSVSTPVIYTDSQSALSYSRNRIENVKTKHIDIRYHFVKELYAEKRFILQNVPGCSNIADMLTKPLTGDKFNTYCSSIFETWEKRGIC